MTLPKINGSATVVAIFGDPVIHSLSPAMHNAAFAYLGWNCVYIPCLVKPDHLAEGVQAIRALNLKGANVTIPHKQAVIPYLDEIIGDAGLSGSVNTIINRDGKLYGASTDGIGLIKSLEMEGAFDLQGKKVLVLGAGGTATAIVFSLINAGIEELILVNRDQNRANSLKQKVFQLTGTLIRVAPLTDLPRLDWGAIQLLINTTSVGLHDEQSLVPKELLNPGLFVYDVVYHSGGTKLQTDAKAAGCKTLAGRSMLLYQGVESFRLWFEIEPPVEVMRKAINVD
ncbi:MAG TPA: shikimate dehydrogenase [Bacillota bacterium]|nr:shikimate dehydrogenase [Bacillota bacterium]